MNADKFKAVKAAFYNELSNMFSGRVQEWGLKVELVDGETYMVCDTPNNYLRVPVSPQEMIESVNNCDFDIEPGLVLDVLCMYQVDPLFITATMTESDGWEWLLNVYIAEAAARFCQGLYDDYGTMSTGSKEIAYIYESPEGKQLPVFADVVRMGIRNHITSALEMKLGDIPEFNREAALFMQTILNEDTDPDYRIHKGFLHGIRLWLDGMIQLMETVPPEKMQELMKVQH